MLVFVLECVQNAHAVMFNIHVHMFTLFRFFNFILGALAIVTHDVLHIVLMLLLAGIVVSYYMFEYENMQHSVFYTFAVATVLACKYFSSKQTNQFAHLRHAYTRSDYTQLTRMC